MHAGNLAVIFNVNFTLQNAVDAEVRVIVLRGHGATWSAGYDVEQIPPEMVNRPHSRMMNGK